MNWIRNKHVVGTHKSIMVAELIANFKNSKKTVFVDCTFGAGGHSKAIRQNFPSVQIFGFDRDPIAKNYVDFKDHFYFFNTCFSKFLPELIEKNISLGDCMVFADLGMSNLQIFDSSRGFSYQNLEAEFNLSMGEGSENILELINKGTEQEIFSVLREFSEEKYSSQITTNIIKNRPLITVGDMVKIIKISVPYRGLAMDSCLSRVFQGFRIYANNEIEELEMLLESASLMNGSSLSIISFHSIEDRIVKNWMKRHSQDHRLEFPRFEEKKTNPQSRSAKMRTGIIKNKEDFA